MQYAASLSRMVLLRRQRGGAAPAGKPMRAGCLGVPLLGGYQLSAMLRAIRLVGEAPGHTLRQPRLLIVVEAQRAVA